MKKLLTAGVALLSVATLAACSGKTASESSSKDAKASSSKVEKSSTSESKSSSSSKSSKSATSSTNIPEIVLLTDEETIGDMKNLYSKLVESYKKYAQDIGQQIPEAQRDAYTQQVDPAIKALDESKTQFDTMLSSVGPDSTTVPEQGRTTFLQQVKTSRDAMKQALESAYKMVAPYTSAQ